MENGDLNPLTSAKRRAADLCEVCQANDERAETYIAAATMYCVECSENLCDECSWHHKRQKLSRLHKIVALSRDIANEGNWKSSVCDNHGREQQMYCIECKFPICMICFDESHQLHKCSTINKAAEDFKNRIESALETAAESYSHETNIKCRFEQNERDFINESKNLQDEILRRGTELKEIVDQHTDSLSRELHLITEKHLIDMGKAKEEIESHLMKIGWFKVTCNEIISKGSAGEICTAVDHLIEEVGQIKQCSEYHGLLEHMPQSKLSLRKANIEDFLSSNNVIGTITGVSYSSVRLTAKLSVGQRPVCGVTKWQNKIYVLCHSPSSILAFQGDDTFLQQTEIKTDVIRKPMDIVASEKSECLYISDGENNCVWQVGEDFQVIRWLTGVGDPFTLSVTLNDRLLMVRKGQPSNLELYGPQTSSIQNIVELPRLITNPCHAVEVSIGHFFICCGGWNSQTSHLYEFTEYGQIVRHFNWGVSSEQVGIPRHLSADVNGGVFVADSWGSRVLLFDLVSDLGKTILTENKEGSQSPWRLCFDKEKRQLIVVHGSRASGTVGVYSLHAA